MLMRAIFLSSLLVKFISACSVPAIPSNGSFTVADDGTLTYSCDFGFVLNGARTRTCQTNSNTWSGVEPACDPCDIIVGTTGLSITVSPTGATTISSFTCAAGYTMVGSSNSTCLVSGSWDSTAPTCYECDPLVNPSGGYYNLSTNGVVTMATYFCNLGYTMSGQQYSYCQNSGTWNETSPTCNSSDPGTGASTDSSELNIPVAAFVIVILIVVIIIVLLAVFVRLYCCKIQKMPSRVASAVSRDPAETKERDLEAFAVPKPTGEKELIVKKYQNLDSRPSSSVTASTVIFANGATPAVEKKPSPGKVQLPPIGHLYTEKIKKKRIGEISPEKKQKTKNRTPSRREPRAKTPIKERMKEIGIDRVITPELLSSVDFNYLQPIFTSDLETDADRDTVPSRKGERIKRKKRKRKTDNDVENVKQIGTYVAHITLGE